MLAWLSGIRCRLAYGPAVATAITISCSSKSRLFLTFPVLLFWYLLTRVVLDKFQKSIKTVVCVCVLGLWLIQHQLNCKQFFCYIICEIVTRKCGHQHSSASAGLGLRLEYPSCDSPNCLIICRIWQCRQSKPQPCISLEYTLWLIIYIVLMVAIVGSKVESLGYLYISSQPWFSFWPTVLSVEPMVQCVVCRL